MNGIQWASVFGLLLSFYALYVEHQAVAMPGYKAACDIESLGVSCSKVFKSKYGRMMSYFGVVPNGHAFDQPNAVLGIAFYGIALLLPKMKFIPKGVRTLGMWLASCVSCASSAWLGYILVNVLHDICIVCVSTYVVNAIIFFFSTRELLCGSKKSVKAKGD